jgi:ferredoxin
MRIDVDTTRCVGAGACVLAAPHVFDQRDDDGTVIVLQEHPAELHLGAARKAETDCPALAIRLVP